MTLKAISAGKASISLSATDGVIYGTEEELDSMAGSSTSVTVKNEAAGSNTGNNNTGNNVQITPANSTTGSSDNSTSNSSSDDQKVTGVNGGPGVKKDSANNGNNDKVVTGQAPG